MSSGFGRRRATISWCTELKYFSPSKEEENSKQQETATNFGKKCKEQVIISSSLWLIPCFDTDLVDKKRANEFLVHGGGGLTALASFPGSGNTWLRYLLQQATGE